MHPTRELIAALRRNDVPQTLGELLLANHVASLCDPCQRSLLAARERVADAFVDRLIGIWSVADTADERAAARRDLDTLLEKTPERSDRLRRIERATSRFRSPLLVAVALAEARSCVAADPDASLRYAEIACAVARQGKAPVTSYALSLAYAGNARRAAGELSDAKPFFSRAYGLLDSLRSAPHPWVLAEIASLEGSLLKDAGQLSAAEPCLLYSGDQFAIAGDTTGRAKVQVQLAAVHHLDAEPQRAIDVLDVALDGLRGVTDPKLVVSALHNYVLFLSEADQLDRAQNLLDYLTPVYDWYPEFEERHLWLRGTVARRLGSLDTAEVLLRNALHAFLAKGSPVYSALVALDLAELLISSGRPAEVVAFTQRLPPLFRAQGVHHQATTAIVLFHRAASQQALTDELLSRLRSFFQRSQRDHSVRFSPR